VHRRLIGERHFLAADSDAELRRDTVEHGVACREIGRIGAAGKGFENGVVEPP